MKTRSQIGRLSRTKGKRFELFVANALKHLFPDARRQPQSQIKQIKELIANGSIPAGSVCLTDVVAGPFGIECKHRKVLPKFEDTLRQAEEDAGKSGKLPVAVHKKQGGLILVALSQKTASSVMGTTAGAGPDLLVLEWDDFLCWAEAYRPKTETDSP